MKIQDTLPGYACFADDSAPRLVLPRPILHQICCLIFLRSRRSLWLIKGRKIASKLIGLIKDAQDDSETYVLACTIIVNVTIRGILKLMAADGTVKLISEIRLFSQIMSNAS